jgi:hypothetical protein
VHRIEQPERFNRPILQIAAIALKRHHAANMDIPQIHRRMAVDDPISENLAGAAGGLNPD